MHDLMLYNDMLNNIFDKKRDIFQRAKGKFFCER